MYPLNSRASYLFKKYYNKAASPEEVEELFYLLKNITDEEVTRLMREEWENLETKELLFDTVKSMEILDGIIPGKTYIEEEPLQVIKVRRMNRFQKLYVAAAVIIVLGFGLHFFRRGGSEIQQQMVTVPVFNDVPPGGNKAILMLADGKQIILDSLQNGLILRTSNFEINKTQDGQLAYQTFDGKYKNAKNAGLNMISTPRGGEYKVILPDGTKVWLNAASSLKFPTVFLGAYREVELKGEAYFEVAKNPQMPFKVRSRVAEIEVLGTHFNVRAYNDERAMKTTLVEGSVQVKSRNSNKILKPGEQAVLEGGTMLVSNVDVEEHIAWKNGLFQFKDASLEDVMKQAALWYDLKVIYLGKIPQKQFTGKTSRKVNASEFLNMLRYIGVEFKREGKEITIIN
jgi:hypothetical protein